jgi:hypothetical protein
MTKPGGAEFVPPEERIATFDNDGTLMCEHPLCDVRGSGKWILLSVGERRPRSVEAPPRAESLR